MTGSLTSLSPTMELVPSGAGWEPRYNIAPTQPVPVIRQHPKEPRRDLSVTRDFPRAIGKAAGNNPDRFMV